MSVVPLRPDGVIPNQVAKPDEELIETLETILTDARSGQLRAFAYVLIDRDRGITTGWNGHADDHDMTAGVNLLAFRYMKAGQDTDD